VCWLAHWSLSYGLLIPAADALFIDDDRVLSAILMFYRHSANEPWKLRSEQVWNGDRYVTSK